MRLQQRLRKCRYPEKRNETKLKQGGIATVGPARTRTIVWGPKNFVGSHEEAG
jgi:hypothetical protein